MTTDHQDNNLLATVIEAFNSVGSDGMKTLLEAVLNAAMKLERENTLQADHYERSDQRLGYANGFKDKKFNSRMGKLELKIPQTRGIPFYPGCLEKGMRS